MKSVTSMLCLALLAISGTQALVIPTSTSNLKSRGVAVRTCDAPDCITVAGTQDEFKSGPGGLPKRTCDLEVDPDCITATPVPVSSRPALNPETCDGPDCITKRGIQSSRTCDSPDCITKRNAQSSQTCDTEQCITTPTL